MLAVKLPAQKKLKILARVTDNIAEAEKVYGKENVFLLPCGKCSSCLISKRQEWSVRCVMESKYHEDNCFITLTYDNDHVPLRLQKKDLQDFIHRLRDKIHQDFNVLGTKYFACGEYGDKGRPHYHMILFGFKPQDLHYFGDSSTDNALFTSDYITKIWNKGLVTIQEFSPSTAGYVAGYVNKKMTKVDGFLMMSNRPGLGKQYMLSHLDELLKYDCAVDDFGIKKKVFLPRYFEKLASRFGLDDEIESLKIKRRADLAEVNASVMLDHGFTNKEQLLHLSEVEADVKLSKLQRRL